MYGFCKHISKWPKLDGGEEVENTQQKERNLYAYQNDGFWSEKMRPASWSSGQSLCLQIMSSRVRFPVLPWEFSPKRRIPAVTLVWVG